MPKNHRSNRAAAVEILPSLVRLAVLEFGEGETIQVQTASIPWRQSASSLAADEGRLELAAALRQLAGQYRLTNMPVHVALSGDFCVTRVITGLSDEVRRELQDLEQRSGLYLSLGHGEKATASCITAIDARHQRAMLAVANDRILNSIIEAFHRAGLPVLAVEPALVSLCRLAGQLGADAQQPALVVRGDERGVEVGISLGGQLLLDYRPAARHAKEQAGDIIVSHLHRLERYCERYVRISGGQLKSVYVSGEPALIEMVERGVRAGPSLQVLPLTPQSLDSRWRLMDEANSPEFAAAMGAALLGTPLNRDSDHPNLLQRQKMLGRRALLPALATTLWPAAAVLLLSAVGLVGLQIKMMHARRLEAQLAALEPQQSEARMLRLTGLTHRQEIAHLERIAERIHAPNWNQVATMISQCLPEDVWLDDLRVDDQGRIQLVGASFSEDGVFEFVRWLEQLPVIDHVALSGTRPTRLDVGPATQFDVRCDFAGNRGGKGAKHDNG